MAYGFSLMASSFSHTPVLAAETLKLLDPQPGQTVVDCTAGRGGHSLLLAGAVGPRGRVLGFDVDPGNLTCAAGRLEQAGLPYTAVCENFVRAPRHLVSAGLRADVVLADLGFSSDQMDDPQRGLSFSADGPLDMRLDPDGPVTAAELIERCTEEELAEILSRYGEDPYARSIARNLARSRQREPIRSTAQLARLVEQTYGARARRSRMHPATRTFMALRIAVNDELTALQSLLEQVMRGATLIQGSGWLAPGARVAVISFHSLEDRLVKRAFNKLADSGLGTRLTKRPIVAGTQEIAGNPRSRSARLRAIRIKEK